MPEATPQGTRTALGALRGAVIGGGQIVTVGDAWEILRGVAASAGIPPGTYALPDVSRAVGQLNNVIRARDTLAAAPPDQLIRGSMVAVNPGKVPPTEPETVPRFLVTYKVDYQVMGAGFDQYLTSEFYGGLPSTVGDLMEQTTTDATVALTEYDLIAGGAVSGLSDFTILQM